MKAKEFLTNERGVVLVISLLILTLLIGAGVGAIVSTQTDLRISANLKAGKQAFFLAEAGIEWGKQQIKDIGANPPEPVGSTQTLSPGSFTVTFNDATKESQLVGKVTVVSTGNVGSSTNKIQALITKTYELSDGALSIRGTEANPSFTGNAFIVDGRDYNTDGTLVPDAKAQFGISVPNDALGTQVRDGVASNQEDNIVGKGGTEPNIEQSEFLPSSEVTQLANDICSLAGAIVEDIPSDGELDVPTNQVWGTPDSPQTRCINGLVTGDGSDKVDFGGNFTGAGNLVVRDANIEINGAWHWEGLIIVTGENVGFEISGGGNKEIYGSIIINETSTIGDSGNEVKLQGAVSVRYSSSALRKAIEAIGLDDSPLSAVYDSLPSTITQTYWRTVND